MVTTSVFINSFVDLLTEAYDGPPDPSSTWFIDNETDSGILGILAGVSAEEASKSIHETGERGSTIAANAEHLRWSLANFNAAMRGEPYSTKWSESWDLLHADQAGWDRLRKALRAEFEALREGMKKQAEIPEEYFIAVLAILPHAAYHLGTIRQMVERVRS